MPDLAFPSPDLHPARLVGSQRPPLAGPWLWLAEARQWPSGAHASPSPDLIVLVLALLAWCIGSLWPHLAGLWLRLVCSFAVAAVQGRLVPAVADFLANPRRGQLASPCLPV